MGITDYFSNFDELLNLPDNEVTEYIWNTACLKYDKSKLISRLLSIDHTEAATKKSVSRILKLDVNCQVISRFALVIAEFLIARNSPGTKDFLRTLLFKSEHLTDRILVREISFMLCTRNQRDLLEELNALIHGDFIEPLRISFRELCNKIMIQDRNYSYYETCTLIVKLLGHSNTFDLEVVLKVIEKSSASLDLAVQILEHFRSCTFNPPLVLEFADRCLSHIVKNGFARYSQVITDNREFMGDASMKILLERCYPCEFGSDAKFLLKFEAYVKSHREEYLRAVFFQFFLCPPLLERLLIFPSLDILYINGKLILGRHTYVRAERFRLCSQDDRIILYEEITSKKECAACTERLRGTLYTDKRDSFGIYYCEQCAQSLIDAGQGENISRVACPVCMGEESDTLEIMNCRHAYCGSCVLSIADHRRPVCPVCRKSLNSTNIVQISVDDATKRFLAS